MICAWIDTSSADTGSSQTISFGLERQRPGDADALALAAGELGREAVVVLGVEADQLHQLLHLRACAPRRRPIPWIANGSPMIEPTGGAGSASRTGPGRSSASRAGAGAARRVDSVLMSVPSNEMRARRSASCSRVMQRASVDLPQPVSPTSPSVSPRRTSRLTPSTARTRPAAALDSCADVTGKYLTRSATSSSTSPLPSSGTSSRSADRRRPLAPRPASGPSSAAQLLSRGIVMGSQQADACVPVVSDGRERRGLGAARSNA